jgi:hypothetical protein
MSYIYNAEFGRRNVGAAGCRNGRRRVLNVDQDKPMAEASEPARPSQRASNVIPFPMPQWAWGPVSIDFDLDHFAQNWLPIASIVMAILARDRSELQLAVKQLGHDGLRDLINDLGQLEQKFLSVAEFARAASAHCQRALAVMQH